jgi:hypothetical protein
MEIWGCYFYLPLSSISLSPFAYTFLVHLFAQAKIFFIFGGLFFHHLSLPGFGLFVQGISLYINHKNLNLLV